MANEDNDVRIGLSGAVLKTSVLPSGLQSIMSWIADLLMRLDRIPWVDGIPSTQRSFLLLLEEIDIHLHPAWQRKVIPVVQKMFPKAQIIASTHSPFVVTSAENARVIIFSVKGGKSQLVDVLDSQRGSSYGTVLHNVFGIESEFDVVTEDMFVRFREAKSALLSGETADRSEVDRIAGELAERSEEAAQILGFELRQLDRQLAQAPPWGLTGGDHT
jgi:AAA domain, putative AbiEii toxin, Type IV TA system